MGIFDFLKAKIFTSKRLSSDDEERVRSEWKSIEDLRSLGKPSTLKEAVNRADKLLDFTLSKLSAGQTLGERIKFSKDLFSTVVYDKVWKAHKVRNAMAHELNYDPPHFITKEALDGFKEGFCDLGVRL